MKRIIKILKVIRSHTVVPIEMKDLIPRTISLLSRNCEHQITSMRDAIQHLESDLISGKIVQGQALMLEPGKDHLELGELSIAYSDLAKWITQANEIADRLARYRPEAENQRG